MEVADQAAGVHTGVGRKQWHRRLQASRTQLVLHALHAAGGAGWFWGHVSLCDDVAAYMQHTHAA